MDIHILERKLGITGLKDLLTWVKGYFISLMVISGLIFWSGLILDAAATKGMGLVRFVFWFYVIPLQTGFMFYILLILIFTGLIKKYVV